MNKTRLPRRRTFVLDFCGCKIDELFCGYLQFLEILHVYIIGIYSQLERKMIDTWIFTMPYLVRGSMTLNCLRSGKVSLMLIV